MPIYEFYCEDCNTLFNFFTSKPTSRQPACPRCGREALPRRPSRFATLKHRGADEPDPLAGLDESRLETAMGSLLGEMENFEGEEDPRSMARLMRRFSDLTGLEMGERMEDYMSRLEAGEDPESLEREMEDGELGDEEIDEFFHLKKALRERAARPRVDEELHFF